MVTGEYLLLPDRKFLVQDPEISIVVPALNEELTIGEFVEWCWEGLKNSDVNGEIIIVDSSSDNTAKIALEKGAKVLKTPREGLGKAYIAAVDYISGKFVIMGDCDLTYDFRDLGKFVASFRSGNDFVMGSRFRGNIEKDAMPALHRYFGTPITTWLLNLLYSTRYTDIHCGMRGITLDSLRRLKLASWGWEYASEMVLKASRLGLKIDEVPVNFYKDREGRVSHHKRTGWVSPWIAGWVNLRVMLTFSADKFIFLPSALLAISGSILVLLSLVNTTLELSWRFGTNSLLAGFAMFVMSLSLFLLGVLVRLIYRATDGVEMLVVRHLTFGRGMVTTAVFASGGVMSLALFVKIYLESGVSIANESFAIIGIFLLIISGLIFALSLSLELFRTVFR